MGVFEQFPYTNFHELNLDWVLKQVRSLIEDWAAKNTTWNQWVNDTDNKILELETYVRDYFQDLDVQEEINNKLDDMYNSGALADLIRDYLGEMAEMVVFGYNGNTGDQYSNYQNCTILKLGNGKNVMLDCGASYEDASVIDWFVRNGCTKIDYIIISHYHGDHVGNFKWLTEQPEMDFSGAIAYLAAVPPEFTGYTDPKTNYDKVLNACIAANIVRVYPDSTTIYNLSDAVKVKFYNTNHEQYYSLVDNAVGRQAKSNMYNNCSLCAEVYNANINLWFPGDIEIAAQTYLADKLHAMKIANMAHHGASLDFYMPYFYAIAPETYVAQNGNGNSTSGLNAYLDRYSAEAWEAFNNRIFVFATSGADDYTIKATFNSFSYRFYSPAMENKRSIKAYAAPEDFVKITSDELANKTIQEFYNDFPNNSFASFILGNDYRITPQTGERNMQLIFKTNSGATANYFGDAYNVLAFYVGLDESPSSRSGDVIAVSAIDWNGDGNARFNISNLTGATYAKFTGSSSAPGQSDPTSRKGYFSAKPLYFGEVGSIDNEGNIKITRPGVYRVDLTAYTISPYVSGNMRVIGRVNNGTANVAALTEDITATNVRSFTNASSIVYIPTNGLYNLDIDFPGTVGYEVTFTLLSYQENLDETNFFG